MKGIIQKVLLITGIVILILFIKNVNLKIVSLSFAKLGLSIVGVLFLYVLTSILIKSIRWKFLMKKISKKNISLGSSFLANLAGIAGGSLLPGRIDLVKPLIMKTNYEIKMSQSLSALLIERALDLLTLLLIAAVALFLIPFQTVVKSYLVFGFIIIVVLALFFLIFLPKFLLKIIQKIISPLPTNLKLKVEEFTSLLLNGFASLKSKKFVILMMLLSFITMGLEVLRFYLLMYFLGIPITIAITGFTLAIAVIIGVLTMIPGGVGITEFSAAGILVALLGSSSVNLIQSAVLIDRFISYYVILLIGGIVLLFYSKVRNVQLNE